MSTYSDVKAQIVKLEKQAAELFKKEVAGVISTIQAQIKEYGLTAADLGLAGRTTTSTRKKASTKPAGVPKYRDPISGKTWTGHGKAPAFINKAVKNGKSRDDFLIERKASAGNGTKAPQPAKKPSLAKKPTKGSVVKAAVSKARVKKPKVNAAVAVAAKD